MKVRLVVRRQLAQLDSQMRKIGQKSAEFAAELGPELGPELEAELVVALVVGLEEVRQRRFWLRLSAQATAHCLELSECLDGPAHTVARKLHRLDGKAVRHLQKMCIRDRSLDP